MGVARHGTVPGRQEHAPPVAVQRIREPRQRRVEALDRVTLLPGHPADPRDVIADHLRVASDQDAHLAARVLGAQARQEPAQPVLAPEDRGVVVGVREVGLAHEPRPRPARGGEGTGPVHEAVGQGLSHLLALAVPVEDHRGRPVQEGHEDEPVPVAPGPEEPAARVVPLVVRAVGVRDQRVVLAAGPVRGPGGRGGVPDRGGGPGESRRNGQGQQECEGGLRAAGRRDGRVARHDRLPRQQTERGPGQGDLALAGAGLGVQHEAPGVEGGVRPRQDEAQAGTLPPEEPDVGEGPRPEEGDPRRDLPRETPPQSEGGRLQGAEFAVVQVEPRGPAARAERHEAQGQVLHPRPVRRRRSPVVEVQVPGDRWGRAGGRRAGLDGDQDLLPGGRPPEGEEEVSPGRGDRSATPERAEVADEVRQGPVQGRRAGGRRGAMG